MSTKQWGVMLPKCDGIHVANLVALLLALADAWLTWRVAVHGPAIETGFGATRIIRSVGPTAWTLGLLSGVLLAFLAIRVVRKGGGKGWATMATGYVLGMLMYNVVTNAAIALRVGAL